MVIYPPVVSVAGFANVDRGMFRAVSNLTNELECFKKQVRLVLLRNSLQICRGVLEPLRLDRLVYCAGTFAHISVRVFLLMDGQKLGVVETSGVLMHRVPTYEEKHSIYALAIFCIELPFTTKILTVISILPLSTKRTHIVIMTIRHITTSLLKLTTSCFRRNLSYCDQFNFKHRNRY
jgi:hypothetical protein